MKNSLKIGGLLAVMIFFVGCCACRSYQKQTRQPLVSTEWRLIQLGGRNIRSESGQFTVRFAEDGTLSGVGSCNRLTGRYELTDDRMLKIGPIASTRMACPSGEDTEAALIQTLEATDHYDMDGPMLLLLSNGELRAVFQANTAASVSK